MEGRMGMAKRGVKEIDSAVKEIDSTVKEIDSTVNLNDSHCDLKSLEDSIKIPIKKAVKITTTTTTSSNDENFKTLEQEIGSPTPFISRETGPPTLIISQDLQNELENPKHPPGCFLDAIRAATGQNKHNPALARIILDRRIMEGQLVKVRLPDYLTI